VLLEILHDNIFGAPALFGQLAQFVVEEYCRAVSAEGQASPLAWTGLAESRSPYLGRSCLIWATVSERVQHGGMSPWCLADPAQSGDCINTDIDRLRKGKVQGRVVLAFA
jgi:hypothetical protein